jgi:hypothetical protein
MAWSYFFSGPSPFIDLTSYGFSSFCSTSMLGVMSVMVYVLYYLESSVALVWLNLLFCAGTVVWALSLRLRIGGVYYYVWLLLLVWLWPCVAWIFGCISVSNG